MEKLENLENISKYSIENNQVIYTDDKGNQHNLGLILNKEDIEKETINKWWNEVQENVNINYLITYIKNIDTIVKKNIETNQQVLSYSIPYGLIELLFDNHCYSIKFNKSELKLQENKIAFFKNCFTMNDLDLDKILNLKFPNAFVEYKINNILVTIL